MTEANLPFRWASSRDHHWLVNSFLLADVESRQAVVIDSGGPMEPILDKVQAWGLELQEVWCTHHHPDHVAHNSEYRALGCRVRVPALEAQWFAEEDCQDLLRAGDSLSCGTLSLEAWSIPGHTLGQMAFVLPEYAIFTGDTLFRGSVGGTMGHGHGTTAELKHAIMERMMKLPKNMAVFPGHQENTTIGDEWEQNPFIRYWRGIDSAHGGRCQVRNRDATLLVQAEDYDGGWKCLLRLDGEDEERLLPGSRVSGLS